MYSWTELVSITKLISKKIGVFILNCYQKSTQSNPTPSKFTISSRLLWTNTITTCFAHKIRTPTKQATVCNPPIICGVSTGGCRHSGGIGGGSVMEATHRR